MSSVPCFPSTPMRTSHFASAAISSIVRPSGAPVYLPSRYEPEDDEVGLIPLGDVQYRLFGRASLDRLGPQRHVRVLAQCVSAAPEGVQRGALLDLHLGIGRQRVRNLDHVDCHESPNFSPRASRTASAIICDELISGEKTTMMLPTMRSSSLSACGGDLHHVRRRRMKHPPERRSDRAGDQQRDERARERHVHVDCSRSSCALRTRTMSEMRCAPSAIIAAPKTRPGTMANRPSAGISANMRATNRPLQNAPSPQPARARKAQHGSRLRRSARRSSLALTLAMYSSISSSSPASAQNLDLLLAPVVLLRAQYRQVYAPAVDEIEQMTAQDQPRRPGDASDRMGEAA